MEHPAYLALEEAVTVLADWSAQVSAGATGDIIAQKYFTKTALLRGTLSAMLRFQSTGKNNAFAHATNSHPEENTISQYFDYFGGENIKRFGVTWNADTDSALRIAPNIWVLNAMREFEYKPVGGNFVKTVAVLTFLVTREGPGKSPQISSLISSPLLLSPPPPLNETVVGP